MTHGRWIVELGIDNAGFRELAVEVPTHDRGVALALARMARGRTVAEALAWAGAEPMDDPAAAGADRRPIAGASIVYYDGEETRRDTATDVW